MAAVKEKNILYISYDGMTDPLGQSQVIPYLIGLTKKGYSFTILSCEKKDRYAVHRETISSLLSVAEISWEPILYTKTPPVFSTLYDYYQLKHKAKLLHSRLHFSAVHCRSYIPALLGLWMSRTYQIPFIFDMRGFWADERVDGGLWNLKNPVFKTVYNYFKKKETEFLNESAAVVSLTKASKAEMLKWKGLRLNGDKISIIPCCVDTGLFDPEKVSADKKQEMRQQLGIEKSDVVIGYLGSIGTWYLLDEMMCYFSKLQKKMGKAKFLFVTINPPEEIYASAQKYDVDISDIIITEAARDDVPLMISLFNYSLFFIKPSYSKMSSSPTKQGELMSMGVPVICNAGVGDTDQIVKQYNAGLIVTDWEMDESIRQICEGFSNNAVEIREGALDFFSLEKGVAAYSTIYDRIFDDNNAAGIIKPMNL